MDFDHQALLSLMSSTPASVDDPTIAKVKQAFFKDTQMPPVKVVSAGDYEGIGLPAELREGAKGKVGFRVFRGDKPDDSIYVNRHSKLYQQAADSNDIYNLLLLAGHLTHENEHSQSRDERDAYNAEAKFLRDNMNRLGSYRLEPFMQYVHGIEQMGKKEGKK